MGVLIVISIIIFISYKPIKTGYRTIAEANHEPKQREYENKIVGKWRTDSGEIAFQFDTDRYAGMRIDDVLVNGAEIDGKVNKNDSNTTNYGL